MAHVDFYLDVEPDLTVDEPPLELTVPEGDPNTFSVPAENNVFVVARRGD